MYLLCARVCALLYVWKSEDNLKKSVLFFHHMCSRDQIWVPGLVLAPLPAKPSQLSVCTGSSVNAAFGFLEWIPWALLLRRTVSMWSVRWQLAHIPLVSNILTCFSVSGALSLVKCLWKSSLFDLDCLFSYDWGSSVCEGVLLHITLIIQLRPV